jgi:alanyl-tRNA synthetase
MTERLYYSDCYLREFRALVTETAEQGRRVYLDRTAFYAASGGQPFDLGKLAGIAVVDVIDEEERIAHLLEAPLRCEASAEVEGSIDWARRYDHMQQHTGQHLLSAVLEELYQIPTLSFHMGTEFSAIELGTSSLEPQQMETIEERCAEIVGEARPVSIDYEEAGQVSGLRKESQRSGTLRVVSIEGIDRSACGGTHVRSTAEIGPVLLRKLDKVRGNVRLEFVCGGRALKRARDDYQTLTAVAKALSAPAEKAPELVRAMAERVKTIEKNAQRLAVELAGREGRELYAATAADSAGLRRTVQRGAIDDAMRARAQAFVAGGKAVFVAVSENPPSLLVAASSDSGVHAGELVKAAMARAGGRGGGNPALAQGSVGSVEALVEVLNALA